MDSKTLELMKSLIETIGRNEEVRKAFQKMLIFGEGKRRIRRFYGLLSIKSWWYLVFRTCKGRGAYLFLRMLEELGILTKKGEFKLPKDWKEIWKYICNCDHSKVAQKEAEEDYTIPPWPTPDAPEEPEPEPDTQTAESEIGPWHTGDD